MVTLNKSPLPLECLKLAPPRILRLQATKQAGREQKQAPILWISARSADLVFWMPPLLEWPFSWVKVKAALKY